MCRGPLRTQLANTKGETQLTGLKPFNRRLFIKKEIIGYLYRYILSWSLSKTVAIDGGRCLFSA